MAVNVLKLGTNSTISIGTAGEVVPGGTFNTIGGITSGSFTISHNVVDTTNNDDSGYTSFLPGNTTITLSVTARFDPVTDTSGLATIEDIAADVTTGAIKTLRAWRVRPTVGSGTDSEWSFDGYVTSFELNPGENDAPIDVSFEVQAVGASVATGVPTWSLQS